MKRVLISVLILIFAVLSGNAQFTNVNVGTSANSGTGDPLRTAYQKLNYADNWFLANFLSLSNTVAGLSLGSAVGKLESTNGTAYGLGIGDGTTYQPLFLNGSGKVKSAADSVLVDWFDQGDGDDAMFSRALYYLTNRGTLRLGARVYTITNTLTIRDNENAAVATRFSLIGVSSGTNGGSQIIMAHATNAIIFATNSTVTIQGVLLRNSVSTNTADAIVIADSTRTIIKGVDIYGCNGTPIHFTGTANYGGTISDGVRVVGGTVCIGADSTTIVNGFDFGPGLSVENTTTNSGTGFQFTKYNGLNWRGVLLQTLLDGISIPGPGGGAGSAEGASIKDCYFELFGRRPISISSSGNSVYGVTISDNRFNQADKNPAQIYCGAAPLMSLVIENNTVSPDAGVLADLRAATDYRKCRFALGAADVKTSDLLLTQMDGKSMPEVKQEGTAQSSFSWTMTGDLTLNSTDASDVYVLKCNSSDRNIVMGSGFLTGRQLTIYNNSGSANTITFDSTGIAAILKQGEIQTFVFNGLTWGPSNSDKIYAHGQTAQTLDGSLTITNALSVGGASTFTGAGTHNGVETFNNSMRVGNGRVTHGTVTYPDASTMPAIEWWSDANKGHTWVYNGGSSIAGSIEGTNGTWVVGGTSPTNSPTAQLEISSTSRGVLMPRLTQTQRDNIISPPDGLMLYGTTSNRFFFREGGAWNFHLNSGDILAGANVTVTPDSSGRLTISATGGGGGVGGGALAAGFPNAMSGAVSTNVVGTNTTYTLFPNFDTNKFMLVIIGDSESVGPRWPYYLTGWNGSGGGGQAQTPSAAVVPFYKSIAVVTNGAISGRGWSDFTLSNYTNYWQQFKPNGATNTMFAAWWGANDTALTAAQDIASISNGLKMLKADNNLVTFFTIMVRTNEGATTAAKKYVVNEYIRRTVETGEADYVIDAAAIMNEHMFDATYVLDGTHAEGTGGFGAQVLARWVDLAWRSGVRRATHGTHQEWTWEQETTNTTNMMRVQRDIYTGALLASVDHLGNPGWGGTITGYQPSFTTGIGVTNIGGVLSGTYTAGANVTFTTNSTGVSIAAASSGASNPTVVSKTTNYTASTQEEIILCDASSGAFTITMPAASGNSGLRKTIIKTDSSTNVVTVAGNASETIVSYGSGANTAYVFGQNVPLNIICNGTLWQRTSPAQWITLAKTSDTTINSSATLADIPGLIFPVQANTSYDFTAKAYVTTANSVMGFKATFNGPASPTGVFFDGTVAQNNGTAVGIAQVSYQVSSTYGASSGTWGVLIHGTLRNGANAGYLSFQGCQSTSDAGALIFKAGSSLSVKQSD